MVDTSLVYTLSILDRSWLMVRQCFVMVDGDARTVNILNSGKYDTANKRMGNNNIRITAKDG